MFFFRKYMWPTLVFGRTKFPTNLTSNLCIPIPTKTTMKVWGWKTQMVFWYVVFPMTSIYTPNQGCWLVTTRMTVHYMSSSGSQPTFSPIIMVQWKTTHFSLNQEEPSLSIISSWVQGVDPTYGMYPTAGALLLPRNSASFQGQNPRWDSWRIKNLWKKNAQKWPSS